MSRIPTIRALGIALVLVVALGAAAAPCAAAGTALPPLIQRLTGFVASTYDSARGGFVTRDRAPNEAQIELAWRLAGDGDPVWARRARRSIDWTWSLYDSVGGGFLHDERDARRDVASFEKNTDANSWRLENLIDAYLVGRKRGAAGAASEHDAKAIRQVLDFFERVLLDARGGFVAGQVGDRQLVPEANGAAIHAYFRWAAVTGETRWRDFAWLSLERVWTSHWNPDFGFLRLGTMGQVISVPRLDDQVEMGRAFVMAAHVAGREQDLQRAKALGEVLLNRFEDRKLGGMRVQVALGRDGKVKGAARDPEPNARAARFLAELAGLSGEQKYRDAARRLIDAYVVARNRAAVDDADWVLAMRAIEQPEFPERPQWKAAPAATPKSASFGKGKRKK